MLMRMPMAVLGPICFWLAMLTSLLLSMLFYAYAYAYAYGCAQANLV